MPHHLCHIHCTNASCKPFYLSQCNKHDGDYCCTLYPDFKKEIHVCPSCKGPACYARLNDKKQVAFQSILSNPDGDPENIFLQSGLLNTRKDAEAFINYIWLDRNSYPLMIRLLDDILATMEKRWR
jgi:hypothetical protein